MRLRSPKPQLPLAVRPLGRYWFWYDHPRLRERFFNGPYRTQADMIGWIESGRRQGFVRGGLGEERVCPDRDGVFVDLYYFQEPAGIPPQSPHPPTLTVAQSVPRNRRT